MKKLTIILLIALSILFSGCGGGLAGDSIENIYDATGDRVDNTGDDIADFIRGNSDDCNYDIRETYTYHSKDGTNLVVDKTDSTPFQKPILILSETSVIINVGSSKEIPFTLQDDTEIMMNITTADEDIAVGSLSTSTNTLLIQALQIGNTVIEVSVIDEDNNIVNETVNVTVIAIPVDGDNVLPTIEFDKSNTTIDIGESITVVITTTDTDGTISSFTITPATSNAYADIEITQSELDNATADATVIITGTSTGNFDLMAVAVDDADGSSNQKITITVGTDDEPDEPDEPNDDGAIYDPEACVSTGFKVITDNSFDPEGYYDNANGIAVKSLYAMTFNPSESQVVLYYKESDEVDTEDPHWNVYYDGDFDSYYISYTDKWFTYANNTVYIKTPDRKCYRTTLSGGELSSNDFVLVTSSSD